MASSIVSLFTCANWDPMEKRIVQAAHGTPPLMPRWSVYKPIQKIINRKLRNSLTMTLWWDCFCKFVCQLTLWDVDNSCETIQLFVFFTALKMKITSIVIILWLDILNLRRRNFICLVNVAIEGSSIELTELKSRFKRNKTKFLERVWRLRCHAKENLVKFKHCIKTFKLARNFYFILWNM